MKILVTGFEPFGGDDENASGTAVLALRDVVTGILPVEFGTAAGHLHSLIEEHRPSVAVCVGEAGLRTQVSVERRARNLVDARIPDNAGRQPRGEVIDPTRGEWLETTFDVGRIAAVVDGVAVSEDAGLFVCNEVYFRALNELQVPVLFVHVPAIRTDGAARVGAETDEVRGVGDLPTQAQVDRALAEIVAVVNSDVSPT
ncbi:MAG TPA: pyroglutamyl-peptidase I [Nocardioidaceae bacterium]|nr:pyroglutamyl-peptidase I [Nocardioidaceae bacterium]